MEWKNTQSGCFLTKTGWFPTSPQGGIALSGWFVTEPGWKNAAPECLHTKIESDIYKTVDKTS